MTQGSLPIARVGRYSQRVASSEAGIVAIDRFGDEELVLRFLPSDQWGEQAKDVRIEVSLAYDLKRLLDEELGEVQQISR